MIQNSPISLIKDATVSSKSPWIDFRTVKRIPLHNLAFSVLLRERTFQSNIQMHKSLTAFSCTQVCQTKPLLNLIVASMSCSSICVYHNSHPPSLLVMEQTSELLLASFLAVWFHLHSPVSSLLSIWGSKHQFRSKYRLFTIGWFLEPSSLPTSCFCICIHSIACEYSWIMLSSSLSSLSSAFSYIKILISTIQRKFYKKSNRCHWVFGGWHILGSLIYSLVFVFVSPNLVEFICKLKYIVRKWSRRVWSKMVHTRSKCNNLIWTSDEILLHFF